MLYDEKNKGSFHFSFLNLKNSLACNAEERLESLYKKIAKTYGLLRC